MLTGLAKTVEYHPPAVCRVQRKKEYRWFKQGVYKSTCTNFQ